MDYFCSNTREYESRMQAVTTVLVVSKHYQKNKHRAFLSVE